MPALGSASAPVGWLSLGLDLEGTDADRRAWAEAVGVEVGALERFPATALVLTIEHGGAELARVPASRVGRDLRVAASVEGEAALLLWAALTAERPALVARVVVSFYYQLVATRIRVWAERSGRSPSGRPEDELNALIIQGRAGVIVEPESPLAPELLAEVEARALSFLAAACAAGSTSGATAASAAASAESFSFELSLHEVLAGSLAVGGVLTPDFADATAHLHRVDLTDTIARPVTLGVVCPAFESALLSAIHVRVRHPAEGTPRRTEEFLLDGAGGDHLYATVATREESDEVAVEVRVWLPDAPEPWARPELRLPSGAILVIDPDRCGVLRVEVSASGAPWGDWQRAEVELAVGEFAPGESAPGEQWDRLLLGPGELSRVWEAVVRADPPPCATMRTRWMGADGRWTEGETRTVGSGRCFIAPPIPARTTRVDLLAAGDWTDLERIIVEVAAPGSTPPDENEVRGVFTFTASGERHAWTDAVHPYRARITVVGEWGSAIGDWEPHDDALLVVLDRERRTVEIVPTLLGIGERIRLARVEVEDRSGVHDPPARAAITFTTPAPATWRYRTAEPVPVYRWRLLMIDAGGARVDTDWREGRGDVLVLTPAP